MGQLSGTIETPRRVLTDVGKIGKVFDVYSLDGGERNIGATPRGLSSAGGLERNQYSYSDIPRSYSEKDR